MKRSDIKKLIKRIILESDEIDPDIEGDPYSGDDVRAGSDIEGLKKGGTGMPHGHGYPNFRINPSGFSKEEIEKIVRIETIEGVSESELDKEGKRDMDATYNYIQKHYPWIFTFSEKKPKWDGGGVYYPFADSFGNLAGGWGWRLSALALFGRWKDSINYWKNFSKDELKKGAKNNPHWVERYVNTIRILKKHPDFEKAMEDVIQFMNRLWDFSIENPENSENYPLNVSLYDVTRRLGGHEEGGWWYDKEDPVHSIEVKNYKEIEPAVENLLKLASKADLNGKPHIILEKEAGHRGNKPPPEYS